MEKVDPSDVAEVLDDKPAEPRPSAEKVSPSDVAEDHTPPDIHVARPGDGRPGLMLAASKLPAVLDPGRQAMARATGVPIGPTSTLPPESLPNPLEGVQKLLHPVGVAAGNVAGGLAQLAEPNDANLQEKARHQIAARTPVSAIFGDSAFDGMDPSERDMAEQALKSHYGTYGAGALKFAGQTLPMFLGGGGSGAAEQLPALTRLWESVKTGGAFGFGQSLFNPGENPALSTAVGAAAAGILHFPLEGMAGAIGWVSGKFKGQLASEAAEAIANDHAAVRPLGKSEPTLASVTKDGKGVLSVPNVDGTVKAKEFSLWDTEERQHFLEASARAGLEIHDPDGHALRMSKEPDRLLEMFRAKQDEKAASLAEAEGKAAKKTTMAPASKDAIASARAKGLLIDLPSEVSGADQGRPSIATANAKGDIRFAPTVKRAMKGGDEAKEAGDTVIDTITGKRGTYLGDTKDGRAILQPPPGFEDTRVDSEPPFSVPHHEVAHADGLVDPPDTAPHEYPEVNEKNLKAFARGAPNPSTQDVQAFFGVEPAEAAVLTQHIQHEYAPDTVTAPPGKVPPRAPPPVGGGSGPPPEPSQPSPGAPRPPTTEAQLNWLANGAKSKSLLESIWSPLRPPTSNMSAPDSVRTLGIALNGRKAMMGKEADYLKAMKSMAPELFNNKALMQDLSHFFEDRLTPQQMAQRHPAAWAKAGDWMGTAKRQIAAFSEGLNFDPENKYLAMRLLAKVAPEQFRQMGMGSKIDHALAGAQRDWKMTPEQAWEVIHEALGTDNPEGLAASGGGGPFSRLMKKKSLPFWYTDLLSPADGPVRVAHTLATQETLMHLRAVADAVRKDPNAWSPVRGDKMVPVPDDLPDRIFGAVKGGFWHRDLDEQLAQSPKTMTSEVAKWGMFWQWLMQKSQGVSRFIKANSVFGPSTFGKHVISMGDKSMLAGGLLPWKPREGAQDISAAVDAIRAYRKNPLLLSSPAEAEPLHALMRNGGATQSFAAYETKDMATRSALNTLMEGDKPNSLQSLGRKGADALFKNGGLAGRAAEVVYQGLQDVTQLANFIALRRRFFNGDGLDSATAKLVQGNRQAADSLAAKRISDSFPNAANTGYAARAIRNNPASATFMTYATPALEQARIYSMVPQRIRNGEKDLLARLALNQVAKLGLYGGGWAGKAATAYAGYEGGKSLLGWLRHMNGISDEEVRASRDNLMKADRLYHPALIYSAVRDPANGEPIPFDDAYGEFAMEAAKGVSEEQGWAAKSIRAGLNLLGSTQIEPISRAQEAGAAKLGLVNPPPQGAVRAPPPVDPGHPVAGTAKRVGAAAAGMGMMPFAQPINNAMRAQRDLNPSSPMQAPMSPLRVGLRAAGAPVPRPGNQAAADMEDKNDLQDKIRTLQAVAKDQSTDPEAKARIINQMAEELKNHPALQRIQRRNASNAALHGGAQGESR